MGYYIQTKENKEKAAQMMLEHGAIRISPDRAQELITDPDLVVLCAVENPMFDAVLVIYNEIEFQATRVPSDRRPKTYLAIARSKAKELNPDCPL